MAAVPWAILTSALEWFILVPLFPFWQPIFTLQQPYWIGFLVHLSSASMYPLFAWLRCSPSERKGIRGQNVSPGLEPWNYSPPTGRRMRTVFTGLVSSRYGASIGGLFLALPAIFCASATLIEKHEIRRKREAGFVGERRGQGAAALDAAGAALGALGMLGFAIVFSLMVESSILIAFIGASLAWLVVSVAAWCVRRKMRSVRKARTAEKNGGSAVSRSRYG